MSSGPKGVYVFGIDKGRESDVSAGTVCGEVYTDASDLHSPNLTKLQFQTFKKSGGTLFAGDICSPFHLSRTSRNLPRFPLTRGEVSKVPAA